MELPHQMPLFNRQLSNNFPSYPSPTLINSKEEDGEEQHDQHQQPEDSIDLGDSVSLIASSINDDTDNPISDTISLVLSANDGDIETVTHLLNLGISIECIR